jgi:phage tail protein X
MRVRVARMGVALDALVHEMLGSADTALVDETLRRNPGLARRLTLQGHVLLLGQEIDLPDTARTAAPQPVRLWD